MRFFQLRGYGRRLSLGLLSVLLSLWFLATYSPKANSASAYDTWIAPPTTISIDVGACANVDVTATWYNSIRNGLTDGGVDPSTVQRELLDSAWRTGAVAVYQHDEANFKVIGVVWTNTSNPTINWSGSGVTFSGTTHRYILKQDVSPGCGMLNSSYQSPASSGYQYFDSSQNNLYRIWGDGIIPNYPTGYAGLPLPIEPNYDPDYIPNDSEVIRSSTMEILLDEAEMVIFLGLFLGSMNFLFGWITATLLSGRWGNNSEK